jgi:hypothetical protein
VPKAEDARPRFGDFEQRDMAVRPDDPSWLGEEGTEVDEVPQCEPT